MTRLPTIVAALALVSACVAGPYGTQNSTPPSVAPSLAGGIATPATPSKWPMRSGPLPKDVGCADIIAMESPSRPDPTIPPAPAPTIAGGDAASKAAIIRAAEALGRLQSYQFTLDVVGRDLMTLAGSTFDFGVRGTIDQSTDFAIDAIFGSRLREPDGSAAVSSGGQQIKAGHGHVWETDNVSEVLEPARSQAAVASVSLLTPEGAAARFVVPFAAGYRESMQSDTRALRPSTIERRQRASPPTRRPCSSSTTSSRICGSRRMAATSSPRG